MAIERRSLAPGEAARPRGQAADRRGEAVRPRPRSHGRPRRGWAALAQLGFWLLAFLGAGLASGYRVQALVSQAGGWWPGDLAAAVSPPSLSGLFSLPSWPGDQPVHILLLGTDRRPEERVARSDTLMLLTIDPAAGRALLLSLPRDLWVSIPGYGENRLNTAYFLGEVYGYPGAGAELAKQTVSKLLGVPVEHYVSVDFRGFVRAVDLLGGVTLEVPEPIWDNQYPDDAYGYEPLYIPAGVQHLDGETLLKYVRTRYLGNDFDRMRRQQQALGALAERATSLDVLPRLPELWTSFKDTVSTDLEAWQIVALAQLGHQIGVEGLHMHTVDQALSVPIVTREGAEVLLPDLEGIRLLIAAFVSGS